MQNYDSGNGKKKEKGTAENLQFAEPQIFSYPPYLRSPVSRAWLWYPFESYGAAQKERSMGPERGLVKLTGKSSSCLT